MVKPVKYKTHCVEQTRKELFPFKTRFIRTAKSFFDRKKKQKREKSKRKERKIMMNRTSWQPRIVDIFKFQFRSDRIPLSMPTLSHTYATLPWLSHVASSISIRTMEKNKWFSLLCTVATDNRRLLQILIPSWSLLVEHDWSHRNLFIYMYISIRLHRNFLA